jgi:hypothetical protein
MSETQASIELRPQPGAQETFLKSRADIAIYGGAAGGGKTYGLLLEAVRHQHNSQFSAVLFRRTFPQVCAPGAMWDQASEIYHLLGATPNRTALAWQFPSGALVKFGHLQYEDSVYDWQGSQIALIGFDELTHFSQTQFFYMLSRNRSTCGVRPYVRATTNPDAGSWVAEFIAWWIDQSTGYPIPERSGKLRWFVRVGGALVWGDTAEELRRQYSDAQPKSVTFVPARIYDNKELLTKDPDYLANLKALAPVEQARLLGGNWKVRNEGLVFGGLLECIEEPHWFDGVRYAAGVDWGWKHPAAIVVGALDARDCLHIVEEVYGSFMTMDGETGNAEHDANDLVARALDLSRRYPIELWHCDPAEPRSIERFRRADLAAKEGYNKSVLLGIQAVNARIRTGRLKVARTCAGLLKEAAMYRYPTPEERRVLNTENPLDQDNHAADACRYLVCGLDRHAIVNVGAPPMRYRDVDAPAEEEPQTKRPTEAKPEPQIRYRTPDRPRRDEPPPAREPWWEEQQGWENIS